MNNVVDPSFSESNSELKATRRVSGMDNVVDTGFFESNSELKATRRVSGVDNVVDPIFFQDLLGTKSYQKSVWWGQSRVLRHVTLKTRDHQSVSWWYCGFTLWVPFGFLNNIYFALVKRRRRRRRRRRRKEAHKKLKFLLPSKGIINKKKQNTMKTIYIISSLQSMWQKNHKSFYYFMILSNANSKMGFFLWLSQINYFWLYFLNKVFLLLMNFSVKV